VRNDHDYDRRLGHFKKEEKRTREWAIHDRRSESEWCKAKWRASDDAVDCAGLFGGKRGIIVEKKKEKIWKSRKGKDDWTLTMYCTVTLSLQLSTLPRASNRK
jgi:hypothetical protein